MIDRLNTALEGRYRIERELGEGGMARVFLAEDLRHERRVAVKVLRPELAAVVGAERFLAEIRTTANLQHPNILPLFDSGEADSFLYYVMPYIEGESLRDRLDRDKQLPVDEAVRITGDVAEALHAAHERGVVHRDVKPANILLSGGRPLVADFGIALAVSQAGGGRLTETGLSMGTPYYMSPEQASADRDPTPASDQYSLACVLYEMLVGEPPFPGGSAQAVLARILTGEPEPPSTLRRSVPPNVDAVVMRGLEKLPADRFADAREMGRALRDREHRYTPRSTHGEERGGGSRLPAAVPWVLAAVLAVLASVGWLARSPTATNGEPIRAAVPLEDDSPIPLGPLLRLGLDASAFDVAPDSRTLVHLGWDGEAVRLYRRSLTSYESEGLAGTEGAIDPFLAPSGRWIGYFAGGGLWKVPIGGGEPVQLTNASNPAGGFWGADDRIWFASMEGGRLSSIMADGSDLRVEATGGEFSFPVPVPGGDALLVSGGIPSQISVWAPGDSLRELVEGARPHLLPSGHLTFVRGQTLYAAGFDPERFALTTPAVPIVEGLRSNRWVTSYRITADGTLFYVPGLNAEVLVPVIVDSEGRADTLPLPPAAYGHLAISPDLTRIATYRVTSDFELYVYDLDTGRAQLIDRSPMHGQAIWSPLGDRIAFSRLTADGTTWELVVRSPRSTQETVVTRSETAVFASDWSPDASELFFAAASDSLGLQILRVPVESDAESEIVVGGEPDEWGAVVAPDGRWLAYTSDRAGSYGVYLARYPVRDGAGAVMISAHPGSEEPHWMSDGGAVGYRAGGRWWRVPIRFDPDPVPGEPELMAEGAFINVPGKSWDLLPDGRLLLGDGPRETTVDRINMIPNFTAEIERRLAEASG